MQCAHHPETEAAATCAGCGKPFCRDCLVKLFGRDYCNACKLVPLRRGSAHQRAKQLSKAQETARRARNALWLSILGFVLAPLVWFIVQSKTDKVKKATQEDPFLPGRPVARAARTIGALNMAIWFAAFAVKALMRILVLLAA